MNAIEKSNFCIVVKTLEELKAACNHPYRSGEALSDGTQLFLVSDDNNENAALLEEYENDGGLIYFVNWEDDHLFTEDGQKIEPVYN